MLGLVNYGAEPLSVELRDVSIPSIGDEDVLLEVRAVGVCGSDLHQYHGTQSWIVNYPVVLGHEFSGVIAQTGTRVRSFREGDQVVSETAAVLNTTSSFYRTGQYNLDPNRQGFGYGVSGAMAQYVRVPERCLHHLPKGLPFEKAALTEPCCVAYNATCINSHIRPGYSVAVIGPGPIGLLCALMAKLSGANPLIVIGTSADIQRLDTAKQVGATLTLEASGENSAKNINLPCGDYGVDVVIDASGISATLEVAMEIVRPGGQVTKVGWGPQPYNVSLDPLVQKGVTLQGSYSHNWPIWERVIGMLASGQIDVTPILNRIGKLAEWQDCFDQMHRREIVKAVLIP